MWLGPPFKPYPSLGRPCSLLLVQPTSHFAPSRGPSSRCSPGRRRRERRSSCSRSCSSCAVVLQLPLLLLLQLEHLKLQQLLARWARATPSSRRASPTGPVPLPLLVHLRARGRPGSWRLPHTSNPWPPPAPQSPTALVAHCPGLREGGSNSDNN